jgi:hypothetical protein
MVLPLLLLLAIEGAARPVFAQASWDARLDVTAFPSPYLSDWEANPTIATLTITNPTPADQPVVLVYHVTQHGGAVIATGRSDRILLLRGPPTVLTDFINLSGSSQHDQGLEDQMRRTGRLPEGDHTACVAVTDLGGFVLAEDCATFSIVYPDPPYLIGPMDGEELAGTHPIFQWTPLQVPPAFHLTYVVRISEMLAGQTPDQALVANIPIFETTTFAPHLEYPLSAPPLVEGKQYAWRVQAVDQNGYAASSNEGRSEIWTFRHQPGGGNEPLGPLGGGIARLTLFDPASEKPGLWAMFDTASIDRVMDYLQRQIGSGTLEIPIPFPLALRNLVVDEHGASRESRGGGGEGIPSVEACDGFEGPFRAGRDRGKRSMAIEFSPDVAGGVSDLLGCLGVPEYLRPDFQQTFSLLFAIQGNKDGLPRVTLGIKPPVPGLLLSPLGLHLDYAVFILNLLGDYTIESSDLPAEVAGFCGGYKIDVWGPGTEDYIKAGAQGVTESWQASSLRAGGSKTYEELAKLFGVNFYGVLNFERSNALSAITRLLCALPGGVTCLTRNEVTIRGFIGNHGSTMRGAALTRDGVQRAGVSRTDKWALWTSVPTTPPAWAPFNSLVTSRVLQLEIGEIDSSTAAPAIDPLGDTPAQSRTRIVIRDVLKGFDAWKAFLGVPADGDLAFFGEFKADISGLRDSVVSDTVFTRARSEPVYGPGKQTDRPAPEQVVVTDTIADNSSAWSRTQLSLAWGAKGEFAIFGGPLRLYNPTLRLRRADPSDSLGTNPFSNLIANLSAGWGVGPLEDFGTLAVEFGGRRVRRTTTTPQVNLTPGQEQVTETTTQSTSTRLHFKVTARFSEDAAVDKLVSLLWGLAVPEAAP